MRHLRTITASFVTLFLMTCAIPARAADLIDNTTFGTATLEVPTTSTSLATSPRGYSFTVGGSGINLTQLTFGMYGNAAGTANVGVRVYLGIGSGGTLIADTGTTLLNFNTLPGGGYYSYSLNLSLGANTTYSIMAYNGAAGTVTPRLAKTSQALSLASGVTGVGFYGGTLPTTENYAIRFQGTVVPEPSTWVLGFLSALTCGFAARKRRFGLARA